MPSPEFIAKQLEAINAAVSSEVWKTWEWWIPAAASLIGLGFSIAATWQARAAKIAAKNAAKNAKTQSVAVELSEVSQRLAKLHPEITYSEARDNTTEIMRRINRSVKPYANSKNPEIKKKFSCIETLFHECLKALEGVRPNQPNITHKSDCSVYYSIDMSYCLISAHVAELLGAFEHIALEVVSDAK